MKVFIYCLFDENDIPIYIGKTKNSLNQRKIQHSKRLNQFVFIFELDYIENKEWKFWEQYYISLFKSWGFNLYNNNEGGGGPSFHTEETKNKMRNSHHPGTSEKLLGRKRSDVSKRLKGKKLSLLTKQKISNSKRGHKCYNNLERGEKIKNSNNKHYQKNSNRNTLISKQLKGRKVSWMGYKNKPILQFDKQGNFIKEWESASIAALFLDKKPSAISECCNNKRKSAYGYIWKFK